MRNNKVKALVSGALIAALYAALTLCLAPLSFGLVQIRIAEALSILAVFTPHAIWGLTVGCMLSNGIGFMIGMNPVGMLDIFFGSAATLVSCLLCYAWRNAKIKGLPILSTLPAVVINGLIIGAEITWLETGGLPASLYWMNAGVVALGQIVPCIFLGLILYRIFIKYKLDQKLFSKKQ